MELRKNDTVYSWLIGLKRKSRITGHPWLAAFFFSLLGEHCFSFHLEATGPASGAAMGLISGEALTMREETGRKTR